MKSMHIESLKGKTALVSGATGGIGESIARKLAECGCNLILTSKTEKKLKLLSNELLHFDVNVDYLVSDLRNMFKNVQFRSFKGKHNADDSGKSIHNSNVFTLSNGTINIWCTLWSDKVNFNDGLNVSLRSKEYNDFLLNENDY